jgi:hypothetical protein
VLYVYEGLCASHKKSEQTSASASIYLSSVLLEIARVHYFEGKGTRHVAMWCCEGRLKLHPIDTYRGFGCIRCTV